MEDGITELMVLGDSIQQGREVMTEQTVQTLLGSKAEIWEVDSVSFQHPPFSSQSPLCIRVPSPLDSATHIEFASSTLVYPLERSMKTYMCVCCFISQVILNSMKQTMKINHQSHVTQMFF